MTVLVIYDGDCRFCRWGISWISRWDRRGALDFCPFGHPVAEAELGQLPADRRYESMHVVLDGRLYSATEAARLILEQLPFGGVAVALGLHMTYPLLARYRWLFGRMSPDRPATATCG